MSEELSEDEINERANEKARKRKAARNKILATKTVEKGLLIVHTGKGKGKSTAAFGMVFRCIGHGFKTAVIQFVKGSWETGERSILENYPELCTIKALGEGFTWETQDRARDIEMAELAWAEAKKYINDPEYKPVSYTHLTLPTTSRV